MDARAQDPPADRLARGETDARAEAPADHQHQCRAEWSRAGIVDLEVVQHRGGGGRAQQDTADQACVLGGREPETATVTIGDSDQRRRQDHQVYEVKPHQRVNTLAAANLHPPICR